MNNCMQGINHDNEVYTILKPFNFRKALLQINCCVVVLNVMADSIYVLVNSEVNIALQVSLSDILDIENMIMSFGVV